MGPQFPDDFTEYTGGTISVFDGEYVYNGTTLKVKEEVESASNGCAWMGGGLYFNANDTIDSNGISLGNYEVELSDGSTATVACKIASDHYIDCDLRTSGERVPESTIEFTITFPANTITSVHYPTADTVIVSADSNLTTGGSQLPQVTGFNASKTTVSDTTSFFLQKLTSFFANNVYLHDDLKTDLSTRLRALETSITEANTQVTQALQQSNPRREVPITDEKPTLTGFTYEFQGVMGTSSEITDTDNKWSVVFSFNMGVIDVMLRIQDGCEISVSTGIEILSQLTSDEKALIMSVIGSTSYRGVVATRFTSEIPQENYSVDYDSANSTITFKGTDISGASETDIFQPGDYTLRFFTDYDGVTDVDQIEETTHFSKLYRIYTIKASEESEEPEAEP